MLDENIKEGIQDLDVTIMFCAGPRKLVKLLDDNKNNYFYNTFCFYVEETQHYVVFVKMYKALKRKQKDGSYFSLVSSTNTVLNTKEETYSYLNNFINSFEEHQRFINEDILQENSLNAIDAINSMVEWEKSMLSYFNDLIPDVTKKNKWNLLRLF